MNEENQPLNTPDVPADSQQELLVAYLDGELDSQQTVDIERRLADDLTLRQRLHELQKTWDVLDCLPQTITADAFTKSTIVLVTREATREIRRTRGHQQATWLRLATFGLLGVAGIFAGFQTLRAFQTAPARQLARDLRVIENMELYRSIDSLEFLKKLEQAGLFVSEDPEHE